VASVFLIHENEGGDKHVESIWFPCLDEGSTPSSSTFNKSQQATKVRQTLQYQRIVGFFGSQRRTSKRQDKTKVVTPT